MPRCRVADCNIKYALYNLPGESPGICCAKHKEDGMIDVKHKKCLYENCNIRPNYNYENEKTGVYCSEHKLKDMIDVINKLCIFEGCKSRPHYNYENNTSVLYCSKHKLDNMILIDSAKCIYIGCNKQPIFNFENKTKPLYCLEHKIEDMIDIKNKPCIFEGCNIRPNYNYDYEKLPLFCSKHKLENMIDIKNKRCIFEGCITQVSNPIYKGYCLRDFMYLFPDEPVARNYKVKEKHVSDFIKLHFEEYVDSYDKQIQGGCSKRRPDVFIDLFTHSIIIEIDENQHFDYSCENKRIMQIFEDLSNRPIVFIRFNPDKYIDENGETIKSCFKYHRISGVPMIDNEAEWNKRLETLKNIIEKHISTIPQKEVTIEQLYYDKN